MSWGIYLRPGCHYKSNEIKCKEMKEAVVSRGNINISNGTMLNEERKNVSLWLNLSFNISTNALNKVSFLEQSSIRNFKLLQLSAI